MRRGTDESNIESMGEAAEVIKVNSSSFIEINNENKRNNLKKNNKWNFIFILKNYLKLKLFFLILKHF